MGLVGAICSASSYVAAFTRAANVIFETPEGRPFWRLRPLQMLVTLVMLVALVAVALALVLTGSIVTAVAKPLGVSSTAVSVWDIAKWPVLLLVVIGMFTVLFYATPNVKLRGIRWVAPGAAVALVLWVLASVAFAFYVAHFGSYDKTYGTLGGVVAFLVWLWITNVSLLLGMELNAERERNLETGSTSPGPPASCRPSRAPSRRRRGPPELRRALARAASGRPALLHVRPTCRTALVTAERLRRARRGSPRPTPGWRPHP